MVLLLLLLLMRCWPDENMSEFLAQFVAFA
jgi:hypothetical protein